MAARQPHSVAPHRAGAGTQRAPSAAAPALALSALRASPLLASLASYTLQYVDKNMIGVPMASHDTSIAAGSSLLPP